MRRATRVCVLRVRKRVRRRNDRARERENSVTSERMVGEAPAMRFSLAGYTALYRALKVLSSKVITRHL